MKKLLILSLLLFSFNGWAEDEPYTLSQYKKDQEAEKNNEIVDPLEGFATPVEDPFGGYTLVCQLYSDTAKFAMIIYPRSNHLKFGSGRYELKWSNVESYTATGNEFSVSILNNGIFIKHNLLSETGTLKIDRITSKYHCPTKIDGVIENSNNSTLLDN